MNFKVGDKVELLIDMYGNKPHAGKYKRGTIHTIIGIHSDFIRVSEEEPENGYLKEKYKLIEKDIPVSEIKAEDKGWGF